jgi:SNF2 family DNA or RNA helicase
MHDRILRLGAKKLGCPMFEVTEKLDNIGNRFYKESNLSAVFHERIEAILLEYPEIKRDEWELVKDAIYRYLRTPSFLVRFFPIGQERFSGDTMRRALRAKGPSGESLEDMIKRFIHFQAKKCIPENRKEYLDALDTVKSGYITGEDGAEQERLKLVPNVRLVNGSTKQAARQTLMLTFNTPFFPEVLIASSVMAEGVDLHLNCRYIIHHDLCWNPSTLEQRTGRVDRIGSKGEVIGESVNVYLPFISETQDEKMCRVVMDRERWFKVVMGEKYKTDITSTDIMSERIPLPDQIVNELAFDLSVHRG